MPKPIIVTFDRKSYTFDGKYWYGTLDYMTPPRSIIATLNAMLPAAPAVPKTKSPALPRR